LDLTPLDPKDEMILELAVKAGCASIIIRTYALTKRSLCQCVSLRFISTAIAEKLAALMTENYLKDRAGRGDSPSERPRQRAKYEAILAKVPDVEPEAYDKIPTV
jgi:hypothetical protein